MLTVFKRPDNLKHIGEWLKAVRRPDRLKYGTEWLRTIRWLRTISAGAFLLGLLSPDLVGAKMWLAFLVVGIPTGLLGFWLIGKVGEK